MSEKVFDKADLLVVFDEDSETAQPIGSFNSIQKMGQGDMFATARRHHDVRALTRIMFCEKMRFAVVEQRVMVSDFGIGALKHEHPYKRESNSPRLMLLRGAMCHNSANLLREAVRIADEWRDEMAAHVPADTIDLTKGETANANDIGARIMDDVAASINAGALDTPDVTVTASVNGTKRGAPKKER